MTPILIFIWYLLTAPADHLACSLWTANPPDQQALIAACGQDIASMLDRYTLQVVSLDGSMVVCSEPGSEIYDPSCDVAHLDQHRLNLVIPAYQLNLCVLEIDHQGQPTDAEIQQQCDPQVLQDHQGEALEMRYIGTDEVVPPPPAVCLLPPLVLGPGIYQAPASPDGLLTQRSYDILARKLTWYGVEDTVKAWQNRYNVGIYNAAMAASVPPMLLKNMIGVESQFWPLWKPSDAGEVGMIQVTDAGADVALRYSPALMDLYCHSAIDPSRCSLGYPVLSGDEQQLVRDAYRKDMQCLLCTVYQAAAKVNDLLPTYALTVAAYRCYAGEIASDPATDIWDVTLAVFHAGPGCVKAGICPAGLDYIQKVKQ